MKRRSFIKRMAGVGAGLYLPKAFGQPFTLNDPAVMPSLAPDVGWWKMAEGSGTTTADSTANNNTGALSGSTKPSWTTGPGSTNALSFNGSTAYVATTLSNINYASGTITWWQNPSVAYNSGTNRSAFGNNNQSGSQFGVEVYTNNNWYVGWVATGNDARIVFAATSGNFIQSAWHFYAFTWAASGTSIYMDGSSTALASSSTAPTVSNFANNFWIGAIDDLGVNDGFWAGSLCDLRIYSRILSKAEMLAVYNTGAA